MKTIRVNLAWSSVCGALVFALTAAACGGGTPEPASPAQPAASASASGAAAGPETPVPAVWSKDMPKEQQVAFMKKNVIGPMGKVFQGHNAAKYGDFSCKTCHGPEFKTPHDFLPHLTFKDGKMLEFATNAEVAQFMAKEVTPAMASAMGAKPFDPQTHQGFGCNGCHTVDMK